MDKKKRKVDYRHYICAVITLVFLLVAIFRFPYALYRLVESVRDLGLSCAYWFCDLIYEENQNPIITTVGELSATPVVIPFDFPKSWEEFELSWIAFWDLFVTKENFLEYLFLILDILYYVSYGILCFLPVGIVLYVLLRFHYKRKNNDYNKDTVPLKLWKKFSLNVKPNIFPNPIAISE